MGRFQLKLDAPESSSPMFDTDAVLQTETSAAVLNLNHSFACVRNHLVTGNPPEVVPIRCGAAQARATSERLPTKAHPVADALSHDEDSDDDDDQP